MVRWLLLARVGVLLWLVSVTTASAGLEYTPEQTSAGIRYILVAGEFAYEDDLDLFANVVRVHDPAAVVFASPGGNIVKAIELGRLIRSYRLSTFQPRGLECSSACTLAFLGGVERFAEPGALGVHKSSFSGQMSLDANAAVSAVQQITAEVIGYMLQMGVDPALLQLSLQYENDDIRYLSRSEMEHYRVVSSNSLGNGFEAAESPSTSQPSIAAGNPESSLSIPQPRTGSVRHPKGAAPLKADAAESAANLVMLRNGTPVVILDDSDRWYRLRASGRSGYMHHTWVFVDQFESGPFGHRHIQVKSFYNLADAEAYVRSSPLPLASYLATNG